MSEIAAGQRAKIVNVAHPFDVDSDRVPRLDSDHSEFLRMVDVELQPQRVLDCQVRFPEIAVSKVQVARVHSEITAQNVPQPRSASDKPSIAVVEFESFGAIHFIRGQDFGQLLLRLLGCEQRDAPDMKLAWPEVW